MAAADSLDELAKSQRRKDWDRKQSDTSTASVCEEEICLSRIGSFCSEVSEPAGGNRYIIDASEDWRSLTVLLRQALADAQKKVLTAQAMPEKIDAQTQDWRPLATILREQLAARRCQEGKGACCPQEFNETADDSRRCQEGKGACCPQEFDETTEDWRPFTTTLREQLASMQSNSKMRKSASCLNTACSACEIQLQPQDECPSRICDTTQDWRPLTVMLRQQRQMVNGFHKQKIDKDRESCSAVLSGDTYDWRPLAVSLRRQLAAAKLSEPKLVCAQPSTLLCNGLPAVVPERVSDFSSETNDWRPITVALRQHLAQAKVKCSVQECPSKITCETLDWRRTTSMLREQLANAENASKSDVCVSPSLAWESTFAVLVALLAFILAFTKM